MSKKSPQKLFLYRQHFPTITYHLLKYNEYLVMARYIFYVSINNSVYLSALLVCFGWKEGIFFDPSCHHHLMCLQNDFFFSQFFIHSTFFCISSHSHQQSIKFLRFSEKRRRNFVFHVVIFTKIFWLNLHKKIHKTKYINSS